MGRAKPKHVFQDMQTAKAQISLRASAQHDQDIRCPQTESLDTIKCFNGEQKLGWDCACEMGSALKANSFPLEEIPF